MTFMTRERQTYSTNPPLVSDQVQRWRMRLGAISLAVAGLLFVLYPALRPFSDEASLQGAAAFASPRWILAHVLAMLGFILLALGLVGVHLALQRTPSERLAFWAMIVSWLGVGLTLPFYGAEAFALHAIGQEALKRQDATLVGLANGVRFGPGFPQILLGLVLLAVGTILVAAAVWRSQVVTKWSGVVLAAAFVLYIPQFVASQPIRIAHGVLVAIGCLWLAADLWWPRDTRIEK